MLVVVVEAAGVAVCAKAHICASAKTTTPAIAPFNVSRRLFFMGFLLGGKAED
jgi:hypothetical protein